jgi:RNA polymerase sigma factor for flagellar operon FliA
VRREEDRDAQIEAHLPLVKRIFSRLRIGLPAYASKQLEEELLSAGALGLVQAWERYDGREGTAFATFASHRIRGAMLDELRRQDWLSKQARARLKEIQRAYSQLEQRLGRPASEEEAAAQLGMSVEKLREDFVELGPATLVFLEGLEGEKKDGEAGGAWADFIADPASCPADEASEKRQVVERLQGAIGRLPENERMVLRLLLDKELGQMEIAEVMGLTPSRVSQIYSQAVARLQGALLPLFER